MKQDNGGSSLGLLVGVIVGVVGGCLILLLIVTVVLVKRRKSAAHGLKLPPPPDFHEVAFSLESTTMYSPPRPYPQALTEFEQVHFAPEKCQVEMTYCVDSRLCGVALFLIFFKTLSGSVGPQSCACEQHCSHCSSH